MAEIKFCENNFGHGTDEIVDKLKNEGIEPEVESCLGYCGDCAVGPFALVDDELVQADTAEELYEKIRAQL
ncbi:DUF1450 domain-containing protein [Geosporobacter ferrireducens]|uniref:DUF1450 domain-containing protein n=1 Tax=Geosporobacter ferrireducens TaxID=1424294 RepID=A0A1D8GDM5_9FIRM|nr:DUF1450 domain-containing protein [Geosporobacter ferrireducens]AOT69013.1 hypothetical protein Gferi_05245 [Geosporobacter ferrireducens]MTI58316.1 DUF1450 domain-containing protein [Geosporobacter ferrireducens]